MCILYIFPGAHRHTSYLSAYIAIWNRRRRPLCTCRFFPPSPSPLYAFWASDPDFVLHFCLYLLIIRLLIRIWDWIHVRPFGWNGVILGDGFGLGSCFFDHRRQYQSVFWVLVAACTGFIADLSTK
ncbi:hypothetical protein L226DRAFT_165949 [Lentinus tigrinus ALCF2SS1-7]|uniref:Uncharacterized protein n=1 Tax=Lentinus tigrinus ALCF2SS1-6 TaxID=1328759 RepID=A0A5C2S8M9_9APHY|nr:hypothetical protein L227DRAFT_221069 [Lentinus tigrinus ALCF2SS1-6]RPD71948.1 hypothetical protein L226DRAFT_165949 [Lentinus tigrinus ALCF2SS1-7]